MVKGITNAKVFSGKTLGECVYFSKDASFGVEKGRRVLVDMGRYGEDDSKCYVISASSSYCDWGCVFIDNNTVIIFYRNAMTKFSYINGEWEKNSISSFGVPQSGGFVLFPNGTVSMFGFNASSSSAIQSGSILTNMYNRLLPTDITYLGRFNGIDYAVSYYYGHIYPYDMLSNTCGVKIGTLSSGICGGYLDEKNGKGFVFTGSDKVIFFYIKDDGSIVLESNIGVENAGSMRMVGWTGCDVGDYLFFATNYASKYVNNSSISASVKSCLVVYKIVEDKYGMRVIELDNETLRYFQENDCLVQYDNRNDVICIGTRDSVYAYKFNRGDDRFEPFYLGIQLFVITEPYCYRLALSPGLDKAFVSVRMEKSVIDCHMYDIGGAKRKIVKDDAVNYNSSSCFVGFMTGNLNSNGEAEVKVLLPDSVGVKFITNIDVENDEISFEGVK